MCAVSKSFVMYANECIKLFFYFTKTSNQLKRKLNITFDFISMQHYNCNNTSQLCTKCNSLVGKEEYIENSKLTLSQKAIYLII